MTPQAYRVACSQLDPPVSRSPIWSYATAGPRSLASSGSSSPELHLSYRVLTVPDLPLAEAKSASLGVLCSPSRHRLVESTCERVSHPRPTVRPRRFSRPRRFTPRPASRVCFTPQPRPGFTFQGFVPAAQPRRLVGDPYPPVVQRTSPAAESPRLLQLRPPRLQGLAPGSDPRSSIG